MQSTVYQIIEAMDGCRCALWLTGISLTALATAAWLWLILAMARR